MGFRIIVLYVNAPAPVRIARLQGNYSAPSSPIKITPNYNVHCTLFIVFAVQSIYALSRSGVIALETAENAKYAYFSVADVTRRDIRVRTENKIPHKRFGRGL